MPANILAILKNPISSKDIENLLKVSGVIFDYEIPRFSPASFTISTSSYQRIAKIDGAPLSVANLDYRGIQRGAIQLTPLKDEEAEVSKVFEILYNLISNSNLSDRVDFYELFISFTKNEPMIWPKAEVPKLKSMVNPQHFGMRIFEGQIGSADIRTQLWKQITIEPMVENPSIIIVNAIYRIREYKEQIVNEVYSDIKTLLEYLKKKG